MISKNDFVISKIDMIFDVKKLDIVISQIRCFDIKKKEEENSRYCFKSH